MSNVNVSVMDSKYSQITDEISIKLEKRQKVEIEKQNRVEMKRKVKAAETEEEKDDIR